MLDELVKYKQAMQEYEQKKMHYAQEKSAMEAKIKELRETIQLLNLKRADISKAVSRSEPVLRAIYGLNILHEKYRNITAVSSILDYLSTGRTGTLTRTGTDPGAYNIYEDDVRAGKIISAIDLGFNRLGSKIDNLGSSLSLAMSNLGNRFEGAVGKLAEQNQHSLHLATNQIVDMGKKISADNTRSFAEMQRDIKLIADYNEKTSQCYIDKYGIARSREGWPL